MIFVVVQSLIIDLGGCLPIISIRPKLDHLLQVMIELINPPSLGVHHDHVDPGNLIPDDKNEWLRLFANYDTFQGVPNPLSHRKGKGKSSTQKCRLVGDMLVPRRVTCFCFENFLGCG